jgi:6-phosphogluconolactonase (cycloisomerase 2 family)
MKFWKYGRVTSALIGSIVLGLSITCCGVYTSGYMYVTGTQFSQIGAFKIDHDFGYLTPVTGQPFASGGGNPVQEVVLPGGRFLAVVNKGSNNVSIFTIGGAGTLYSQQSYATSGSQPVSLILSASGSYMYVLDSIAPDGTGRGDITAFAVDPNTGKLTLITNQNTFNTSGTQLPYFEVNYKPVQFITAGGFIYALDTAYTIVPGGASANPNVPAGCFKSPTTEAACQVPDVFLYAVNSTNGQLTLTQNAPLGFGGTVAPGWLTTISSAASGKYVYIANTLGGSSSNTGVSGQILPYTIGPGGVLQILVGGPVNNVPGSAAVPDAVLANANANFLYVANFGPGSVQQPTSNISAYTIDTTNGQLQPLAAGSGLNPYPSGSGPVWLVQDPTNQYLYSVNFNDSTITGKVIDQTHGQLSAMLKGTTFSTVGKPTFAVVSGRTY